MQIYSTILYIGSIDMCMCLEAGHCTVTTLGTMGKCVLILSCIVHDVMIMSEQVPAELVVRL